MTTVKISKTEKTPENIFSPGNYVISKTGQQIVLVTGEDSWETLFTGVTVYHEIKRHEGLYSTSYTKELFDKFVGTITISSE